MRRGLAASRGEARDAILAGRVTIGGLPARKPGTLVAPEQPVALAPAARPYASRGGEKLAGALDALSVGVAGRRCLDVGASTGGFTDVLLARGAAAVAALDVGYGQLAWRLRTDPRVTVVDRTNARLLRPEDLPFAPDLVVVDVSFISLTAVLPAMARVVAPGATLVLLVKPQFEADREEVRPGGVILDPAIRRRAVERVAEACRKEGFAPRGVVASPLPGSRGNREVFLLAVDGAEPARLDLEGALAAGAEG